MPTPAARDIICNRHSNITGKWIYGVLRFVGGNVIPAGLTADGALGLARLSVLTTVAAAVRL